MLINAAKTIGGTGYPITFLGAHTGLRRNEMLALDWDDIDWFAKELRVRRALSLARGSDGAHKWEWQIGPVKTRRSNRRIGLTESTVRLLSDLRQITGEGLLFPRPDGRHMNPDIFDAEVWGPITAAAGFNGMRFHDLRHFYASQLIAQGETAAYTSGINSGTPPSRSPSTPTATYSRARDMKPARGSRKPWLRRAKR